MYNIFVGTFRPSGDTFIVPILKWKLGGSRVVVRNAAKSGAEIDSCCLSQKNGHHPSGVRDLASVRGRGETEGYAWMTGVGGRERVLER